MQPRLTAGKKMAAEARWKSKAFRRKFFAGFMRRFGDRTKPSSTHLRFKAALIEAGLLDFETHAVLGHYVLDEAWSAKRLAIEVNGCFWHGCESCTNHRGRVLTRRQRDQLAKDRRRATYLQRHSWRLLVIWEHELSDMDVVLARVRAFTEESNETGSLDRD